MGGVRRWDAERWGRTLNHEPQVHGHRGWTLPTPSGIVPNQVGDRMPKYTPVGGGTLKVESQDRGVITWPSSARPFDRRHHRGPVDAYRQALFAIATRDVNAAANARAVLRRGLIEEMRAERHYTDKWVELTRVSEALGSAVAHDMDGAPTYCIPEDATHTAVPHTTTDAHYEEAS